MKNGIDKSFNYVTFYSTSVGEVQKVVIITSLSVWGKSTLFRIGL
jgi:hypothetical protein